jgi:DNA-directed RNA polymerase subunit RPC12/RpoP
MQIFRRQKSAHALSLILCLLGVALLLFVFWRTWPQISSAKEPLSTFLQLLWTQRIDTIPIIEFRLLYVVILADALLVLSVIVAALSTQRFYLPGKIVWYQCPFCKKDWRSSGDKALVHCPHCRQLVHPRIVEKRIK